MCIHLGLTPQSVNVFGGYKVQGRESNEAEQLKQDAIALEKAGAQLAVLECVPVTLAKMITDALTMPVIGIGAGNVTDGQILVMHDLLGLTPQAPKFSKDFLQEAGSLKGAVSLYVQQVEQGLFPQEQHSFN